VLQREKSKWIDSRFPTDGPLSNAVPPGDLQLSSLCRDSQSSFLFQAQQQSPANRTQELQKLPSNATTSKSCSRLGSLTKVSALPPSRRALKDSLSVHKFTATRLTTGARIKLPAVLQINRKPVSKKKNVKPTKSNSQLPASGGQLTPEESKMAEAASALSAFEQVDGPQLKLASKVQPPKGPAESKKSKRENQEDVKARPEARKTEMTAGAMSADSELRQSAPLVPVEKPHLEPQSKKAKTGNTKSSREPLEVSPNDQGPEERRSSQGKSSSRGQATTSKSEKMKACRETKTFLQPSDQKKPSNSVYGSMAEAKGHEGKNEESGTVEVRETRKEKAVTTSGSLSASRKTEDDGMETREAVGVPKKASSKKIGAYSLVASAAETTEQSGLTQYGHSKKLEGHVTLADAVRTLEKSSRKRSEGQSLEASAVQETERREVGERGRPRKVGDGAAVAEGVKTSEKASSDGTCGQELEACAVEKSEHGGEKKRGRSENNKEGVAAEEAGEMHPGEALRNGGGDKSLEASAVQKTEGVGAKKRGRPRKLRPTSSGGNIEADALNEVDLAEEESPETKKRAPQRSKSDGPTAEKTTASSSAVKGSLKKQAKRSTGPIGKKKAEPRFYQNLRHASQGGSLQSRRRVQ
jgi:hypothetical protein